MKGNLPFDDFVKKQFSSYSPDVPDHIWENIIAKRRSRPKGFWMNMFSGANILFFSLILFIGGGTYFLLSSSNDNAPGKQIAPVKNILPQGVNNVSEKDTKQTRPVSIINKSQAADPLTETNEHGNSVISEKPEVKQDNSGNKNSFVPSFKEREKNITVVNEDKADDELITKNSNSSVMQGGKEITTGKFISPFHIKNARELSAKKDVGSLNIKLPECPALEKDAAGNKKYWEVYAGPDYAFDNYKSYGDTASANYLEKRKASTKFASAFSGGVRYTKVFNNGTSIRAGVNYTQVNEKFLYFNPNEIKYVTVITTRVVIRAPGDTIYFNDTLQYQQSGTRTKTTYNRYRNIDVPVVIGYELGNGKIHANINAGVVINIYSWYKGDVLDSLYQPVTITTGKSSSIYQFKNNIGVGFTGSVSVYYKITDNLHIVIEPYFRYNLSPMSKQNLNLQQKTNIAGLRAGLRFDLK